ncbi:hypothetical protein CBS101457_002097 [Exobasidium rhododendri]|nr:hypothetical protein CBS101457_002097 [Exobasidium rhododendri]
MPPSSSNGSKMMSLINYRLRITLNDGRQMTGQMLAFDQHMNLVMADTEEFRRVKSKSKKRKASAQQIKGEESDDEAVVSAPEAEQKRTLGLIILRGESIVSLSVEGPPPSERIPQASMQPGTGRGMPAGRGMGLAAPPGVMPPTMAGRPMAYARPPPPMGAPGMPGMLPPGFPPPGARPPPGFGGPPPGFAPPGFRPPPPGFPMSPRPQ